MNQEILEFVKTTTEKITGIPQSDIKPEYSFKKHGELHIDDLDIVEVCMSLELEYGIVITDDEIINLVTIEDIVKCVEKHLTNKTDTQVEKRHSRIIICGKGASGKDTLKRRMMERGLKLEVSYTTRPMRNGEADGVDYHFVSEEFFLDMVNNGKFYQHKNFNGWHYGTTVKEWDTKDVFIMTPSGISEIKPEDRKHCFIIYIDIDLPTRKKRLSSRGDVDSVNRRIVADQKDFESFTDFDLRITNSDF